MRVVSQEMLMNTEFKSPSISIGSMYIEVVGFVDNWNYSVETIICSIPLGENKTVETQKQALQINRNMTILQNYIKLVPTITLVLMVEILLPRNRSQYALNFYNNDKFMGRIDNEFVTSNQIVRRFKFVTNETNNELKIQSEHFQTDPEKGIIDGFHMLKVSIRKKLTKGQIAELDKKHREEQRRKIEEKKQEKEEQKRKEEEEELKRQKEYEREKEQREELIRQSLGAASSPLLENKSDSTSSFDESEEEVEYKEPLSQDDSYDPWR